MMRTYGYDLLVLLAGTVLICIIVGSLLCLATLVIETYLDREKKP